MDADEIDPRHFADDGSLPNGGVWWTRKERGDYRLVYRSRTVGPGMTQAQAKAVASWLDACSMDMPSIAVALMDCAATACERSRQTIVAASLIITGCGGMPTESEVRARIRRTAKTRDSIASGLYGEGDRHVPEDGGSGGTFDP